MTLIAFPERNEPVSGASGGESSSSTDRNASGNTASAFRTWQVAPLPSIEIPESFNFSTNGPNFQFGGTRDRGTPEETPPLASLTEVGAAIDEVVAGHDIRDGSLKPDYALTPPKPGRRRRSRSPSVQDQQHQVSDEEPPLDAYNEPRFQAAFRGTKDAMRELGSVLGTSSFPQGADSKMRTLREQAKSLANFQQPATRNVGFVGESGVGKSSLLNSLLDCKDLARASSSGGACTCVVTEYCYEDCDKLRVESELATEDELLSQLAEMLQAYRQAKLVSNDMDASERKTIEDGAKRAEDTFKALFRGRLEDLSFLSEASEPSIMTTFRSWISQVRPAQSDTNASELTQQECTEMLIRLSSESPDLNAPAIWPYLRKIRVFLNAHILKKGLVLTDLPGLRDMNTARNLITEKYLWKCDEVFVVCQIGRATTDQGVNAIFKLAETAKVQVGIVCTMSETIEANEAKNDWPIEISHRIVAFQHTIETEERLYKELAREIRHIEDLGETEELEQEEIDELNQSRNEQSQIRKRLDRHKFEQIKYLMSLRNGMVRERLHGTYAMRAGQDDLPIYCVSNKLYWEKREDSKVESLPYLRLSGVIALRQHCIAIVSACQHRRALRYMKNEIPELLGNINLWVQSGAGTPNFERKELIKGICDEVEERLTMRLQGRSAATANISKSMKRRFKNEIYDLQHLSRWSATAAAAAGQWYLWAHQTKPDHVADQVRALEDVLYHQNLNLLAEMQTPFRELEIRLRTLRLDALTGSRTSFIGRAMEDAYTSASRDRGGGSDGRRKAIVSGRIAQPEIFRDIMNSSKAGFDERADSLQFDINGLVASFLERLHATLDIIRNDNVAEESERDPVFRARVDAALDTTRERMSRLEAAISA